jgi:hypothetical protein
MFVFYHNSQAAEGKSESTTDVQNLDEDNPANRNLIILGVALIGLLWAIFKFCRKSGEESDGSHVEMGKIGRRYTHIDSESSSSAEI